MELSAATKILKAHQVWRLGGKKPMQEPKVITEAIYVILDHLTAKKKVNRSK